MGDKQGEEFRSYIWGEKGICDTLKTLKHEKYGTDLMLVLFKFRVDPIPYELENLKEIEKYDTKEKAIGISIVVNQENFFGKSEAERFAFIKQAILQKIDLLADVVQNEKLDTNTVLLNSDLNAILN